MAIMTVNMIVEGYELPFDLISQIMGHAPTQTRKYSEWPEVSKRLGLAKDEWVLSSKSCVECSVSDCLMAFLEKYKIVEAGNLRNKVKCKICFRVDIHCDTTELPVLDIAGPAISILSTIRSELVLNLVLDDV